MNAIKKLAVNAVQVSAIAVFCLNFLAGCSALPAPPVQPVVYDFGPGSTEPPAAQQPPGVALVPLVLADIQSTGLPEGSTALQYRLAYDDALQLRAYQRARWSQPPASLLRQRVASELARQRPVLDARTAREAARGAVGSGAMLVLRLELEEFSQVFASAEQSRGVLRVRATLAESTPQGERLRAQRLFVAQAAATSQDAAGGSAALASAAAQAAQELAAWVGQTAR